MDMDLTGLYIRSTPPGLSCFVGRSIPNASGRCKKLLDNVASIALQQHGISQQWELRISVLLPGQPDGTSRVALTDCYAI